MVAGSAPEDVDIVKVARAGVYPELGDDYADLLGEKIRDLSLGLDVVDTEDYLAVVRLEMGPVAAFHRAQGFPGWCLGVTAKRDIPHGHLLCLAVGEIREFEEAYWESEDEEDSGHSQDSEDKQGPAAEEGASGQKAKQTVSSGKGKEQADAPGDAADAGWSRGAYDYDKAKHVVSSGKGKEQADAPGDAADAGWSREAYDYDKAKHVVSGGKGKEQADAPGDAADAGWSREAYDYDLLHLEQEDMEPVFLECVDYGNIVRCFNDSENPNAALVHVCVNDIPMRAVFSSRGIAAGEDVCFGYDDKHWQELYGMTRSSVVAPPPAAASAVVVISDSDDDVEMAEAPRGAASSGVHGRSRRQALRGSGFYKEDLQARTKRGAPPGGRRG
mgnify:CR=1 FL=1